MIDTAPSPTLQSKPLTRNEGLKAAHPLLEGTIAQTLADPAEERFSEDDYEFLKFHGIYQQDDRDQRKIAKHYIFMVRGRLPGGVVHPGVYLGFDRLSSQYGNNTIRIGMAVLADVATIDLSTGSALSTRLLDTSPRTATSWQWSVIRRPADAASLLSSTSVRNPTFTPDVAGLFTFRLIATGAGASSITTVDLNVGPAVSGPRRRAVRR